MNAFRTTGYAAVLLLGSATAAAQAPANDNCATAAIVSVGTTPYNTTMATNSGLSLNPANCFGNNEIFADVWYSFTPATSEFFDIQTINNGNPSFDTKLAIYGVVTCPALGTDVLDCDDDGGAGLLSRITISLTAGTPVLIRVGSFSASTIEQPGALVIAGIGNGPANEDCANALAISAFGSYAFDNTLSTTDGLTLSGFCDFGVGDDQVYDDVWYAYTPSIGGCTYISTLGLAGFDSKIAVYNSSGCPDDPATVLACSDEEVQPIVAPWEAGLDVDLTAGSTYLIRVGNFSAATVGGPATLLIAAGPQAFANDGGLQSGAPPCMGLPAFPEGCNGDGGDQMGCTDCPCLNNAPIGTIGGCLNSALSASRLLATGSTSVSLPSGDTTDLRFGMSGGPATAFCILNSGDAVAPQGMANPCFGLNSGAQSSTFDGLRCAVQNTLRHGGRSADVNGDVGVTNNPWGGEGGPPVGLAVAGMGFSAGQTRFFQVIHRDDPLSVCGRGLNTTQSVEVTFTP